MLMLETEFLRALEFIKINTLKLYFAIPIVAVLFDNNLGHYYTTSYNSYLIEDENIKTVIENRALPTGYLFRADDNSQQKLPSIKTVLSEKYSKSKFNKPAPRPPTFSVTPTLR